MWIWDGILISYSGGFFFKGGPANLLCAHLAHSGLLLPQAHYDDAVSLADAALRPRCEPRVGLIEDNTMDVFLLAEPAGQSVLVDTLEVQTMK